MKQENTYIVIRTDRYFRNASARFHVAELTEDCRIIYDDIDITEYANWDWVSEGEYATRDEAQAEAERMEKEADKNEEYEEDEE